MGKTRFSTLFRDLAITLCIIGFVTTLGVAASVEPLKTVSALIIGDGALMSIVNIPFEGLDSVKSSDNDFLSSSTSEGVHGKVESQFHLNSSKILKDIPIAMRSKFEERFQEIQRSIFEGTASDLCAATPVFTQSSLQGFISDPAARKYHLDGICEEPKDKHYRLIRYRSEILETKGISCSWLLGEFVIDGTTIAAPAFDACAPMKRSGTNGFNMTIVR